MEETIRLLDTIPGIDEIAARALLAEIGTKMEQFPTAQHCASWAGLCPGNNESAGKRLNGKTRKKAVPGSDGYWCKQLGQLRMPKILTFDHSSFVWQQDAVRSEH